MSNKPKHSKTNITKISAKSSNSNSDTKPNKAESAKPATAETTVTPATAAISKPVARPVEAKKPAKSEKSSKATQKSAKDAEKPLKSVFILVRPFVALGRYLRDSWREIRQVRWPGRKLTWKMTLAVLVYCAIFIVFIVLLDTFFTFIFNLLINAN